MSELISKLRRPWIVKGKTCHDITHAVSIPLSKKPNKLWYGLFTFSVISLLIGTVCIGYQVLTGIGTYGVNKTTQWGFAITNFVFWIGMAHAGTFISAVLLLFRQKWRNSVNRASETMTMCTFASAAIFPLIHLGRPWKMHWFFPYPNQLGDLMPNFYSPLLWDVMAVTAYLLISLVFWYIGMIPDFATLRDYTKDKFKKMFYTIFSLRWNGSLKTWRRYELVSLVLAAMVTPVVLSVHSVVSSDFAVSVQPGWHNTIFPPFFGAGAIFQGFAMGLTLMILTRKMFDFDDFITAEHFEMMARIVLLTSCLVTFVYITEFFIEWYSGNIYAWFTLINKALGPYWIIFWAMIAGNVLASQLLWFKKIRTNMTWLFIISILVNVGMWLERFVIVVVSLTRDYLPSSWVEFVPSWIELGELLGSFGLFLTLFLGLLRILPYMAMAEVKELAVKAQKNN